MSAAEVAGGALMEKAVRYTPLGGTEEMELKFEFVRKHLCVPTKSGKLPSDGDIIKFMMLCKARALNPWDGDCFLTGYDTNDGPQFSLITAVQALLKRSELCDEFDGIEAGVIVQTNAGKPDERPGTIVFEGESVIGGWARGYRKDRRVPFYQSVQFKVYNTGRSRWAKDPCGMIQKVAKAAVLRDMFPNHLAGLYTRDEMEAVEGHVVRSEVVPVKAKTTDELAAVLRERNGTSKSIEQKTELPSVFTSLLSEIRGVKEPSLLEPLEADVRQEPSLSDSQRESLMDAIEHAKDQFASKV